MDEWTDAEFIRRATEASSAFDDLRHQLRHAVQHRNLPEPGELVGRYRVVRSLGEGGFGTVFEVHHDLLGHRFAMKLLNPRIASDPDWVTRFREEARTTSLIGHENIVYVTDFGEDPTWGSYFVMEYLDGEPLDATIAREGQLNAERVLRFAHAAASAFSAVHEVGVVHCDLKPSNVFTIPRPRQPELWKFLDFGTSTVVMAAVQTQALYGTPVYMAPEQSIGMEVSPLSDQFSLSCVLYEMLTARPPWEVRNWLMATPEVRSRKPPQPPSELSPLCPKSWDEVILRGLAIDPAKRWPSFEMLARALEERLHIDWKPSVDPLDLRHGPGEEAPPSFERTMTAPSVAILEPDAPSVVVDLETGEATDDRPVVRVEFQSRERFMREVHRNLSVGGLFIPSEELLSLRESVRVDLRFAPRNVECSLAAAVVGHETRRDAGRGFGVAFDPRERAVLEDFIGRVRGPAVTASTVLSRTNREVPDTLTPGEWFVLSRVDPGTPMNRLRSLCAGLPIDIDDAVTSLLEQQLVRVDTSPAQHDVAARAPASRRTMEGPDVEAVLDRIEFHRHQANYLGASEILDRAIEMSPTVAVFHHRLALLRMEFDGEPRRAIAPARRATELDPSNDTYAKLLKSLLERQ